MKQWYSARELLGLPGMPTFRENVARKARVENWQFRQRSGRGGGREYALESLPQVTQAALSAPNLAQADRVPALESASQIRETLWAERELDKSLALPAQPVSTIVLTGTPAEAIANLSSTSSRLFTKAKTTESKIKQRTDSWLEILKAHELWCESKSFASAIVRDLEFVKIYNEQQFNLPNWVY